MQIFLFSHALLYKVPFSSSTQHTAINPRGLHTMILRILVYSYKGVARSVAPRCLLSAYAHLKPRPLVSCVQFPSHTATLIVQQHILLCDAYKFCILLVTKKKSATKIKKKELTRGPHNLLFRMQIMRVVLCAYSLLFENPATCSCFGTVHQCFNDDMEYQKNKNKNYSRLPTSGFAGPIFYGNRKNCEYEIRACILTRPLYRYPTAVLVLFCI